MTLHDQIGRMAKINQSASPTFSRRDFIKMSLTAGGGLLISLNVPLTDALGAEKNASFQPNPFVRVDPDNTITIWVARSELGQGVRTSLPMIVAEELEADWESVRIEQAESNSSKYGNQGTGGSQSVTTSWEPLRKAGAAVREIFITAAAQKWNMDRSLCMAEKSVIKNKNNNQKIAYGDLIAIASTIEIPADPPLKNPDTFKLIGTNTRRVDGPAIVTGRALYGLDLKAPNLLYAAVARCPVYKGTLANYDAIATRAIKGVRQVITIEPVGPGVNTPGGVAVIAENTWAALEGKKALRLEWNAGENASFSTDASHRQLQEKVNEKGLVIHQTGDVSAVIEAAGVIEADYETSPQAHAPMEPMNCMAHFRGDSCEVWASTQMPNWVQWEIHQLTGLPLEAIRVNVTLSGGGFGRRINPDVAIEAVQISRAVEAPVKVVWDRSDDMQHDFYHPASRHRLQATVDSNGYPVSWLHRIAEPYYDTIYNPDFKGEIDPTEIETPALPYSIANTLTEYVQVTSGVKLGWWRGVAHQRQAFAIESFVDELAAKAGIDPYEYRLNLLNEDRVIRYGTNELHPKRLKGVLELAAKKAGWGTPLPDGFARGIACWAYISCKTYAAQVVEVSVSARGAWKLHRVVCAIDCGLAVNPDNVKSQVEGGVVFALSAVLFPQITIEQGRIMEQNFDDYQVPFINDAPIVETHIVPSREFPGGVGEPPIPPLAPAIANAIFALTGKRVRRLPILPEDIRK